MNQFRLSVVVVMCFLTVVSLSCNGGASAPGMDSSGSNPTAMRQGVIGDSCQSGDPSHICLGLNFVSYQDPNTGTPVADENLAIHDVQVVNNLWAQCGIGFQIEQYKAVDPTQQGFAFGSEAQNQLDEIRKAFEDDSRLLVVMTGPWNAVKNAWTQLPGAGIYGAILEASVASFPPIMAHELGHYLGLPHPVDAPAEVPLNLMNWLIHPESTQLDAGQCASARSTAQNFWNKMTR